MTTEARETVAKFLFSHDQKHFSKSSVWEDYGPEVHKEYAQSADAILARLAELGYVQREVGNIQDYISDMAFQRQMALVERDGLQAKLDRLTSDAAVGAAMDAYVKSTAIQGFDGYMRAAIAAAITKAEQRR